MSVNIKVSGKVYNGVNTISLKDDDDKNISFLCQSTLKPNVTASDVNFYDYDGTRVAAYTKADFLTLTALPNNPVHAGLVADGWNWTLADAQAYVSANDILDIGQNYHTESEKCEYDVIINENTGLVFSISTSGEKDWGDGTVDSETSHTYANYGKYTIKSSTPLPVGSKGNVEEIRLKSGITELTPQSYYMSLWGLKRIAIPATVQVIVSMGYCYCLECIIIPSGVTMMYYEEFSHCSSLKYCCMPKSITSVGNGNTFYDDYALESLTFPPQVSTIPTEVLYNANPLKRVAIPSSVTSISASAFQSCVALRELKLVDGLITIGSGAFNMCSSLLKIEIPSTVETIGANAFFGMNCVKTIKVLPTTPPAFGTNAIPTTVQKIYIPNGTLAAYEAASGWSNFVGKFEELPV